MRGENTKKNVPPSVNKSLARGIRPSRPSLFRAIDCSLWLVKLLSAPVATAFLFEYDPMLHETKFDTIRETETETRNNNL